MLSSLKTHTHTRQQLINGKKVDNICWLDNQSVDEELDWNLTEAELSTLAELSVLGLVHGSGLTL